MVVENVDGEHARLSCAPSANDSRRREVEKKVFYEVVEAGADEPYKILQDILENGEGPIELEAEAHEVCNGLNSTAEEKEYYRVVKVTIEDVTTVDDAVAYRASE